VDEDAGERTWRVKQQEIVKEVGVASGRKKFDLRFEDMGSYKVDYTRNGRYVTHLHVHILTRLFSSRRCERC
jgi:U3 small nucleolar RNA-associated protein 7